MSCQKNIQSNFHPAFPGFILICLFLLTFAAEIQAVPEGQEPVMGSVSGSSLKLESVQVDLYPDIFLDVQLPADEKSTIFNLTETYGNTEIHAELRDIERVEANGRFYFIHVIDASRSVPPAAFERSIESASILVDRMVHGDFAAVFRLNGAPGLVQPLTADREKIKAGLDSISLEGMETRIYDALYQGIEKAGLALQADPGGSAAVFLFTDGLDEGSYIDASEALDATFMEDGRQIKVYVILDGQVHNRQDFARLALQSGGALIAGPDDPAIDYLFADRDDAAPYRYRLHFRTRVPEWHVWPGRSIEGMLAHSGENESQARFSYEIPGSPALRYLFFLMQSNPLLFWVCCGLALFISLLILFLLFRLFKHRRETNRRLEELSEKFASDHQWTDILAAEEKKNRADADEELYDLDSDPGFDDADPKLNQRRLHSESSDRHSAAAIRQRRPAAAKGRSDHYTQAHPEDFATDDFGYSYHKEDPGYPGYAGLPQGFVPYPEEISTKSREISLYLKDRAYRLLHSALSQAKEYKRGRLLLKEGGPLDPELEQVYEIFLESTVIGSGRYAQIPVRGSAAAHARIKKVDGKFILYDLMTAPGLKLNGKKLLRPKGLSTGDEIRIGKTVFIFEGVEASIADNTGPIQRF